MAQEEGVTGGSDALLFPMRYRRNHSLYVSLGVEPAPCTGVTK
jgi:hypothetical protein